MLVFAYATNVCLFAYGVVIGATPNAIRYGARTNVAFDTYAFDWHFQSVFSFVHSTQKTRTYFNYFDR